MGTMLWRWNDETTGTILQGTAFCRQNRPGQQQSVAAALDASAGHSRHYAVSGAAVAAGKCAENLDLDEELLTRTVVFLGGCTISGKSRWPLPARS